MGTKVCPKCGTPIIVKNDNIVLSICPSCKQCVAPKVTK